jgi:hypothetical protein
MTYGRLKSLPFFICDNRFPSTGSNFARRIHSPPVVVTLQHQIPNPQKIKRTRGALRLPMLILLSQQPDRRTDMRKHFLIVASSTLLLCFSCLVSHAQTKTHSDYEKAPPYEVGGQIFAFNGHDLGSGWGAGGRFSYNFTNYIAFDSEVNFFLPDEGPPTAVQSLFGIKAGKRTKYVGVFAKVRPGFQTNFVVNDREQARFALDVGGVAEFYPNRHLVLRVDAGDVIIPFGNNVVGEGLFAQRLGTTHNFQASLGVGIRF